jgi:hypothetical protein
MIKAIKLDVTVIVSSGGNGGFSLVVVEVEAQ